MLRNLSWCADAASKRALRDAGAVRALVHTALTCSSVKESTLKAVLSALWNLSAHSMDNKADICAVDGALDFIVTTLTYRSPSGNLAIVEKGGGILRIISSYVTARGEYRAVLRRRGCLQVGDELVFLVFVYYIVVFLYNEE